MEAPLDPVHHMRLAASHGIGADVVIVTTSVKEKADFWKERLEWGRGSIVRPDALLLTLHEDWPGGAGNGLGTLDAYAQARALAKRRYGVDLDKRLESGSAVSLYHAAGQGSRLEPLTSLEGGCKASVKLPATLKSRPLTLLEAVICQTAPIAAARPGRLSVFWSDQLFIPEKPLTPATAHADIFMQGERIPCPVQWERLGLDHYGLILLGKGGWLQLVEKLSAADFANLLRARAICSAEGFGRSLGIFSLSKELLSALLTAFKEHLASRIAQFPSDTFFWMPLTLSESLYVDLMQRRGVSRQQARSVYAALQPIRSGLKGPLLEATDIGAHALWWDFGQVKHYFANLLKLTQETREGRVMRAFFNVDLKQGHCVLESCDPDKVTASESVVWGAYGKRLQLTRSVAICPECDVDLSDCLLYRGREIPFRSQS